MTDFHFEIEYTHANGALIARLPIDPDWTKARDGLHFAAARQGRAPALTCAPSAGTLGITPVWTGGIGAPYVEAFRLHLICDGNEISGTVPRAYFATLARELSASLDRSADATVQYSIRATAAVQPPTARPAAAFEIEEVVQQLQLTPRSLNGALKSAISADNELNDGDMPVLFRAAVLDEARAQAQAAGDTETGGVLVGRLYRDTDSPEIFAEITAQIPAAHTEANTTRLTFTADTWAAASAAIAARGRNAIPIGFWHSHGDWCRLRGCPRERRVECSAALPFLSAEDVHLFGNCFGRAYHTTLLVSEHSAHGWTDAMYGWRSGVVTRRAFHVLGRR